VSVQIRVFCLVIYSDLEDPAASIFRFPEEADQIRICWLEDNLSYVRAFNQHSCGGTWGVKIFKIADLTVE
jgi:hypothetical protein